MSENEKYKDLRYNFVVPSPVIIAALEKHIPDAAVILYGIVSNLCQVEGYCYARNQYLANLMNCTNRQVQRLLICLSKHGFIEIEHDAAKHNSDRKIYLTHTFNKFLPHDKNVTGGRQKCHTPMTKMSYMNINNLNLKKNKNINNSSSSSYSSKTETPHNINYRDDSSLEAKRDKIKKTLMRRMKDSFDDKAFEEAWKIYIPQHESVLTPVAWIESVMINQLAKNVGKREKAKAKLKEYEQIEYRKEYIKGLEVLSTKDFKVKAGETAFYLQTPNGDPQKHEYNMSEENWQIMETYLKQKFEQLECK